MRKYLYGIVVGALSVALVDQLVVSVCIRILNPNLVALAGERFIPVSGYLPFVASLAIWIVLIPTLGSPKTILPLVLMGGGVLSNTASYIRYGVVVDYLPGIAGLRTNSADAMILLGITFLLLSLPGLRRLKRP